MERTSGRVRRKERTWKSAREPASSVDRKRSLGAPLSRAGENATVLDVGATRTPRQNGATECDVSGLRATRETCSVDTSQTKGILSLLASGKKTRGENEERTKASERDGGLRRAGQRGRQEAEKESERARAGARETH